MQLSVLKLFLLLAAVGIPATVGTVLYSGLISPENWVFLGGSPFSPSDYRDGGLHGAPGPMMGAGLPVLAVGYGVYWLAKRRRRKPD
jgi:hypothetical protein